MKRLFLLTVLLMTPLIAVSVALIGVGRAQPIPALPTDEIRLCDGRVCWRGVIVDKTTLGEAVKLLSRYPGVTVHRNENGVTASTTYGTVIFAAPADQTADQFGIENMEVDFGSGTNGNAYPQLGDFITRYGSPCKMTLDRAINTVRLYYPLMYLNLVDSDGHPLTDLMSLTPSLRVGSTISYNDTSFCRLDTDRDYPWLGFILFHWK